MKNMEKYQEIMNTAHNKKTERMTFRLTVQEAKTLERIARHYGISKGEIVRVAVRTLASKLSMGEGVLND